MAFTADPLTRGVRVNWGTGGAVLVGWDNAESIYNTTNGGRSFEHRYALPDFLGQVSTYHRRGKFFCVGAHVAVDDPPNAIIFTSYDKGVTWQASNLLFADTGDPSICFSLTYNETDQVVEALAMHVNDPPGDVTIRKYSSADGLAWQQTGPSLLESAGFDAYTAYVQANQRQEILSGHLSGIGTTGQRRYARLRPPIGNYMRNVPCPPSFQISVDGAVWTNVNPGFAGAETFSSFQGWGCTGLTFGQGKLVACGDSGIFTTSDLVTWRRTLELPSCLHEQGGLDEEGNPVETSDYVLDVVYGGSYFAAVGGLYHNGGRGVSDRRNIWVSQDAETWTEVFPSDLPAQSWASMAGSGGNDVL